jgi:hypothetical protein
VLDTQLSLQSFQYDMHNTLGFDVRADHTDYILPVLLNELTVIHADTMCFACVIEWNFLANDFVFPFFAAPRTNDDHL